MRSTTLRLLSILLLICISVDCSKPKSAISIDGFAQGTTYHMVIVESEDAEQLKIEIDSLLDGISESMSLFDPGSLINGLNSNSTDQLDSYIEDCIAYSQMVSAQSGGLFDITIKPLIEARGFLAEQASAQINVDSLLQYVGYEKISIEEGRLVKQNPNIQIDLSSIAQGYSSDIISDYLYSKGYENYLVEIGGEIVCRGVNASGRGWRVGIDKPMEGNINPGAQLQVILSLPSEKGLATSGNYRKYYYDSEGNRVVHTTNPITGEGVISNLLSATVIASNGALADAYGTLFMVMGLEGSIEFLAEHPEIDAYLIYGDDKGGTETFITEGMSSYITK